jgi:cell division protein FtsW
MTCAALGLLLRVSYELDRAQRQVARVRNETTPPPVASPSPTTPAPAPVAAAHAKRGDVRGTSRLRQRVEPTLGRIA